MESGLNVREKCPVIREDQLANYDPLPPPAPPPLATKYTEPRPEQGQVTGLLIYSRPAPSPTVQIIVTVGTVHRKPRRPGIICNLNLQNEKWTKYKVVDSGDRNLGRNVHNREEKGVKSKWFLGSESKRSFNSINYTLSQHSCFHPLPPSPVGKRNVAISWCDGCMAMVRCEHPSLYWQD